MDSHAQSHRKALKQMDMRTIKHAAKMSEWEERIHACRSSGKPVRTWCEENKIKATTYYRWERLYMTEARSSAGMAKAEISEGMLVRIEPERLREQATSVDVIALRHGGTSVELPAGTSISQLAKLVKALNEIC